MRLYICSQAFPLGETALYVKPFKICISIKKVKNEQKLIIGCTIKDLPVIKNRIVLGKFMPITEKYSRSYYSNEMWSIRLDNNVIKIWNMLSADSIPEFETEFENQIIASSENNNSIKNAISIRQEALSRLAWKRSVNTKIWLVSDRYSHADDNGEAMFKYLMEHKREDIKVYFVLDKDSNDYERLSQLGPVLIQDSREHKIMHLISDCIISSQADEYIIDPFWRQGIVRNIFKDFYCRNKFVFLQHGVIKDDLSAWLNRFNKNIDGFVCAAIPEAKSIEEGEYFYDKKNIWLTGLPRYDRLYHDEQNLILIMPTWRKWLMKDFNASDSDKNAVQVIDNIEHTEFFEFYHSLLNNERLLAECEQYGYQLCYMPHTNFRDCMDKFCDDKRIVQMNFDVPYREAFAKANLLVTDYSSTPMDFAYLRKPVIYAQFDKDKFFSGEHTYKKGYFNYEQNGFGEVVYDLNNLIELIISYIHKDCKMKEKYYKRVDNFFAYNDCNNCERVYKKILNLFD